MKSWNVLRNAYLMQWPHVVNESLFLAIPEDGSDGTVDDAPASWDGRYGRELSLRRVPLSMALYWTLPYTAHYHSRCTRRLPGRGCVYTFKLDLAILHATCSHTFQLTITLTSMCSSFWLIPKQPINKFSEHHYVIVEAVFIFMSTHMWNDVFH